MSNVPAYRIREMKASDISDVASVDRLVFVEPWPESTYIHELYFNTAAHYFVLQYLRSGASTGWRAGKQSKKDPIIGFVGMRVEGRRGHISTLAVKPEWRGNRLGEALFLRAMIQAVRDGAASVGLEVRVSNTLAQNLYVKYGFHITSRLTRYYSDGEDAFFMRVSLSGKYDTTCLHEQLALISGQLDMVFDDVIRLPG